MEIRARRSPNMTAPTVVRADQRFGSGLGLNATRRAKGNTSVQIIPNTIAVGITPIGNVTPAKRAPAR